MKVGTVEKQVISKHKKLTQGKQLQQVVYKTYIGSGKWSSMTTHELV